MTLLGLKVVCAKCGGRDVLIQLWARANHIEHLEGAHRGLDVPAVAPVEAREPAFGFQNHEGAWCCDCDAHVKLEGWADG